MYRSCDRVLIFVGVEEEKEEEGELIRQME